MSNQEKILQCYLIVCVCGSIVQETATNEAVSQSPEQVALFMKYSVKQYELFLCKENFQEYDLMMVQKVIIE